MVMIKADNNNITRDGTGSRAVFCSDTLDTCREVWKSCLIV